MKKELIDQLLLLKSKVFGLEQDLEHAEAALQEFYDDYFEEFPETYEDVNNNLVFKRRNFISLRQEPGKKFIKTYPHLTKTTIGVDRRKVLEVLAGGEKVEGLIITHNHSITTKALKDPHIDPSTGEIK